MEAETSETYAQNRANETGHSYLMTDLGHVWVNVPANRRLACEKDENGDLLFGGIRQVFFPA
jgi:hypothetical protein